MAGVIELLSGAVSLSVAKQRLRNVVHAAQYPEQKRAFYERLKGQRDTIRAVVCHHLGILSSQCVVSPQAYWRHGSFNLCVPIAVLTQDESMPKHVMVRLPLPYRTGEAQRPGNADEKLRCEAAAYAWIQQFCPEVPIPQLYGFGLSSGQRFTRSDFLPWWSRWLQRARCSILALFGLPLPSQYVGHPARHVPRLETGYLIIETITSGDMLSETWKEKQEDASLQRNLYRDLARIILSLASIPLPRIGAFRLDDNGYLHLDNRPLSTEIVMQENESIPVEIPRSSTFSTVDEFILMQLALFDARTVHQPNAIESNGDGYRQMSSRAAAKAAFPQMFRQDLRSGPFAFTLTDLHPSNIIVDDEWNVVSIIDLEFSCSWPLEFQQPPYWLGGELVDEIDRATFAPKHEQFVQALEEQERLKGRGDTKSLSSTMREAWASGTFWITLAFIDPIGFTDIFHDRIVPYHLSYITERVKDNDYWLLASLWRPNDAEFLERKLKDRERYLAELEKLAEKEVEPKTALTAGAATT